MSRYGCLPKTPDARDHVFRAPQPYTGEFVDLSGQFPESPYDQGQLGSCVSNGVAAAVDFARVKAGLKPFDRPSRLFIYYQGRVRAGYPLDQDTGLQIRDGFTVIAKDGAPPESDWQYDITKFAERPPVAAYADAGHDVAVKYAAVDPGSIDATIASGYVVPFGFPVYESFESPTTAQTGVMPIPNKRTEKNLGGHCVVFCSTPRDGSLIDGGIPGVLYRKTRNSWGHDGSWGIPEEPGYFWFPVAEVTDGDSTDFWVVTVMGDPNVTPPVPPSFPGVLVAAVAALAGDPQTAAFLSERHWRGADKAVAARLKTLLAAPRA